MPEGFNFTDLITSEAERLAVAFRQKLIPHPGEFGRAREEIVREFLRQQLPKRFEVGTGFVVDANGGISKQVDVVVYDAQVCPTFTASGGGKFYPCEGVVCVGQIKSSVKSKPEYHEALRNLESVKTLDRSAGGKTVAIQTGEVIRPRENHLDQIFTFVFVVEHCLAEQSLMLALLEHLGNSERHLWPNVTYAFDQYFVSLACQGGICPNPMDAFGMSVVKDVPGSELLYWFCRLVSQAIIATHVGHFSYFDYVYSIAPRPWGSYTFRDAPVKGPLPAHLTEVSVPDWWHPNVAASPESLWKRKK